MRGGGDSTKRKWEGRRKQRLLTKGGRDIITNKFKTGAGQGKNKKNKILRGVPHSLFQRRLSGQVDLSNTSDEKKLLYNNSSIELVKINKGWGRIGSMGRKEVSHFCKAAQSNLLWLK